MKASSYQREVYYPTQGMWPLAQFHTLRKTQFNITPAEKQGAIISVQRIAVLFKVCIHPPSLPLYLKPAQGILCRNLPGNNHPLLTLSCYSSMHSMKASMTTKLLAANFWGLTAIN